jgi:uncharacterized protein DUF6636
MRSLVVFAALLVALAAAGPASAATFFESPSGNIKCLVDKGSGARCDILKRDWKPPPKPPWCPVDWGNGLEVSARGKARFTCAGDAVPDGRPLPYGDAIQRGRYRCRSRRSGMRCVNLRTERGFALSRARVRRF